MSFPQQTITLAGSGLKFINTYGGGVTAAYHAAILYAEHQLESVITNSVTIRVTFGYKDLSGTGFLAENSFFNTKTVDYATLRAALTSHATSADDLAAVAALPATAPTNANDPTGSAEFLIAAGEARVLGLEGAGSTIDDRLVLDSSSKYNFNPNNRGAKGGYDAIGAIEHELTEGGLGRVGGLSFQNSSWGPMDLFRFDASGNRDYTGGQDGIDTYFSPDGGDPVLGLPYENAINASGHWNQQDPGDWGTFFGDSFGGGSKGQADLLSDTDLRVLDVLGWTLTPQAGSSAPNGFVPNDFDGDGNADVLWRNSDGSLVDWSLSGSAISSALLTSNGTPVTPDASSSIVGITDFNGDNQADILWRNTNGSLVDWTMSGGTIVNSSGVTLNGVAILPDASWSVLGVGDFNGDGMSDVLWRPTDGALAEWSMNGATILSSMTPTFNGMAVTPDASWSVGGIGDFDSDGNADILWRRTDGALALWGMNGATINSSQAPTINGMTVTPGASWSIAGIGDFDGDGNADILWRSADGSVTAWLLNGATITSGDAVTFNGAAVSVEASWHVVDVGDFDGDGNADVLWRNDNGTLSQWLMNGSQITSSSAPTAQGASVMPAASWQTQNKPTDFA
jgi:FG-GAP-like repeat